MSKRQKFTPEFRAEAVELVLSSQKSLIEVAASLGINEGTLGNWVRAYRAEHPEAETEERGSVQWAQYEKLRKELLEVKRENELLKDVSAYFTSTPAMSRLQPPGPHHGSYSGIGGKLAHSHPGQHSNAVPTGC